jgi:hypothetical protein
MRTRIALLITIALGGCSPEPPPEQGAVADTVADDVAPVIEVAESLSDEYLSDESLSDDIQEVRQPAGLPQISIAQQESLAVVPELSAPMLEQLPEQEPSPRALDLELLYTSSVDEWFVDEPMVKRPSSFDASSLFEPKKGRRDNEVSLSIAPSFKDSEPGAELTEMPELDGGSLSIEVKTR